MIKYLKVFSIALFLIGFCSCGSNSVTEEAKEEIKELGTIEAELENVSEEIESETEDMIHDVDSLLEGI